MASTRTMPNHALPSATTETAREPAGPAFQRLTAELARARQEQGSERRCRQLERELEELKPRLGYEFNLPQDASLAIVGRLGVARCRAARACRGLRAAVGSARDLGAFRHEVLALAAAGYEDEEGELHGHTVVCTGDAVFSFGEGEHGRLGYEAESQTTPRVVTGLLAEDVVAAAASNASTLVCTAGGRAYWFGRLYDQEYSPPKTLLAQPATGLLGGLEGLVGVAAGAEHLLAWTGSGELYTWGWGQYGQLGHGATDHEAGPRLVEFLAGQQVVGGDGSLFHSVAYTAGGRVYTFGTSTERCLGHGEDAAMYQLTPRAVEGLAGSRVVAVAAGTNTTAAVTEAGELYTWGHGALGHGGHILVFVPQLVAGLAGRRVVGVAAGTGHTLAWTDSGELYSWGYGDYGQLGHNSEQPEWSPRRVEALAGKVVVGAAAGTDHSVVMTRDQKVYTFGYGDEGQLGQGTDIDFSCTPGEVAGLRVP